MTAVLPPGWRIRPPTLDDVPEILAVVHASDIAAVGEPDFTTEEVVEVLNGPHHDPAVDSWLALDDTGRIVGWGYLHNPSGGTRDNLDAYVHPAHGVPAQATLLELALTRIGERAASFSYPEMKARAGAIPSETHYIGLLSAAGFTFVKRYARMRRQLTGSEPRPVLPHGALIRPVRADDEAELRTFHEILEAAFRDTLDHSPSDYETFVKRLAAMPSIAWDEWFIAEVDGVPAAILESAGQAEEHDEGWVRYLAVAAPYRGRGLGRALLETSFAINAVKGRTAVGLAVDTTNPTGAYRLYLGVGMSPVYEADMFQRTVAAAPPWSLVGGGGPGRAPA